MYTFTNKETLPDLLNSILTGELGDYTIREIIFCLLKNRGRGKTTIESLLEDTDHYKTQASDSLGNEQVRHNRQHCVRLLANTLENFDFTDDNRTTVLHYACKHGWLGIVQSLLNKGTDPDAKDRDGDTPILFAAKYRQNLVVDLLAKSGADVLCCNDNNYTLLHAASNSGWIHSAKFFLSKGANPNARTLDGGIMPLHGAVVESHRDVIALLMDSGAQSVPGPMYENSVLHLAVMTGNLEVVKCLVEKGADINHVDDGGLSALQFACNEQNIEILEYLVNAANTINGTNETPLTFVVKKYGNVQPEVQFQLINKLVDRYGYLTDFIEDYYGERGEGLSQKPNIFQNIDICINAIVSKFNDKDLPAFYKLPFPVGALPAMQNLMIQSSRILQDIEQCVRHQMNANKHCDIRNPNVILLRILSVKSFNDYYNRLQEKARLKKSATCGSRETSHSSSKI